MSLAAVDDVIVHDVHLVVVLAVEGDFADIFVFGREVLGLYRECACGYFYLGFFVKGRTEPVASACRLYLVESEG